MVYFSFPIIQWRRIDIKSDESNFNDPDELYSDKKEISMVDSPNDKEEMLDADPQKPKDSDTTGNSDDVKELTTNDLERIKSRFEERRARMISVCRRQGHQPPENIGELVPKSHPFLLNQIFHDSDLKLSGCLPPKTGTTSWNHFWWGISKYDGARPGQFDSFQSQGNRYLRRWERTLKQEQPKVLFLTVRHPIDRLLSGWNNILCNKNCRNADRIRYSKQALTVSYNFILNPLTLNTL